jgi:hypothetical protein
MPLQSIKEGAKTFPAVKTLWGIGLCSAAAGAIILVCGHFHQPEVAPLGILALVGIIAWCFGTWAAMAGLLAGSFLIAGVLLGPTEELTFVQSPTGINTLMMLLFGAAAAYFYGDRETQ